MKPQKGLLLLAGLTGAVFAPVLFAEFINLDDYTHIIHNLFVNQPSFKNVWKLWETQYFHMYIPVMYSFWSLLAAFSNALVGRAGPPGLLPEVFHSANWILHIGNSLMVFFLLRYVLSFTLKGSERLHLSSFLGAAFFGLHPVQVEPVAWVSGAKDLLSTFLLLVCVGLYFKSFDSSHRRQKVGKKSDHRFRWQKKNLSQRSIIFLTLSLVSFAAALLTKPSVVVFPALIWCLNFFFLSKPFKQSLWSLWLYILVAIPSIFATLGAQKSSALWFVAEVWKRPLVALDAISFYLLKIIFPWQLGPDYGRTPEYVLNHTWVYFTALIPIALFVAAFMQRQRRPWLLGGLLILVFSLAPVLGFVPFLHQDISTTADRYLYIGMLAPAIMVGYFLIEWNHYYFRGAIAMALCLFATKSFTQSFHWQSSERLFLHSIKLNPTSWQALYNLAQYYVMAGQREEGLKYLHRCIKTKPEYLKAKIALGTVYLMQQENQKAIELFEELLEQEQPDPNSHLAEHSEIYFKLAKALEAEGHLQKAIPRYRRAVEINWTNANAQYDYARALYRIQNYELAFKHIRKALRLAPTNSDFKKLGRAIASKM